MTAVLAVTVLVALVSVAVSAIRASNARQQAAQAERARAHTAYLRRRAEFLANASPVEAQAFLIQEQTNALIDAQRRATAALSLMMWLDGPHSPFDNHHRCS